MEEGEAGEAHLEEHGPLLGGEVAGQDVPQPDDDPVAAVEAAVVNSVFPGDQRWRGEISFAPTWMGNMADIMLKERVHDVCTV